MIKTQNLNVNLTSASKSYKFPGAAGALISSLSDDQSQGSLNSDVSEAAQEAFTTPGNSKRYLRLQSKGLNNLRAEIIAISEFIPVTTENDDEKSARITKEIGGRTLTVTNVSRLIELHRQLREYTLIAADLVFKKIYPELHTEGFLAHLKNTIGFNFDRLAESNIKKTVDNIVEYLSSEDYSAGSSSQYKEIVMSHAQDSFFLAIVEYMVYDNLVMTIIDFGARIATIDKELGKYWEIQHFPKLKRYSPGTALQFGNTKLNDLFDTVNETRLNDPDLTRSLLAYNKSSGNTATDAYMAAVGQLLNVLTFRDSAMVLETLAIAKDEDLTVEPGTIRIGVQADLADMIAKLKNISLTGFITNLGDGTAQERTGVLNGTYRSEEKLTPDKFNDIFRGTKQANGSLSRSSIQEGCKELLAALCYDIVSFYITRIGGVGDYSVIGTSAEVGGDSESSSTANRTDDYDNGYSVGDSLNHFRRQGNETPYKRYNATTGRAGTNVYFDYFERNFGISPNILDISDFTNGASPIVVTTDGRILPSTLIDNTVSNENGFGDFTRITAGHLKGRFLRTDEEENVITEVQEVNFTPLENDEDRARNIVTSDNTEGAINGIEYFVQSKVEGVAVENNLIEEVETNELLKFSNDYKKYSNKLVEDILTLYPDNLITKRYREDMPPTSPGSHKLTPCGRLSAVTVMNSIFQGLEEDLDEIIDAGNNTKSTLIPQLAILLCDHGSSKNNMMVFLSSAWGNIIRHCQTGSTSTQKTKTLGRFVEYYTERSVITFFKAIGLTPRERGSNAKRKFAGGSEVEYRLLLGDKSTGTGDAFWKEDIENKFNNGKDINRVCGNNNRDGEVINLSMEATKIDNRFDNSMGPGDGKNLDEVAVEFFDVGSITVGTNTYYGMSRIFKNTYAAANNENTGVNIARLFNIKGNQFHSAVMNDYSFNYDVSSTGKLKGKGRSFYDDPGDTNPNNNNGELINFSGHHAQLIAYKWARTLLKKTLQVFAKTNSDGEFTLRIYVDQLKGTIDGLRTARGTTPKYKPRSGRGSRDYFRARDIANNYGKDTLQKIKVRESFIRDISTVFSAHSDGLRFAADKVNNILEGKNSDGSTSPKSDLAINILKQHKIFSDFVTLNSEYSPADIAKARATFFTTRRDSVLMQSEKYPLAKIKLMERVLSQTGFGFLQSEEFGNKSIINVGITNSMISTLQNMSFRETQDLNYLDSPYICISVFKKDHFNPTYTFYPKNFIFDTSANILDYEANMTGYVFGDSKANLSGHLKDFVDTASVSDILKTIEYTRFSLNDNGKLVKHVNRGYKQAGFGSPATGDGVFSPRIAKNHLHDYVLKAYLKLTTGVDMEANNFLLKANPIDYQRVETTNLLGDDLISTYQSVLGEVKRLYPRIDTDENLKSEVFRMVSIIKQSAPFSFVNRFKQLITPNSFDKVYAVLVNEKDFVLESPVDDEERFYKHKRFSVAGGLSRPSVDERYIQNENENYVRSLESNTPEVYSYYVKVSLLPIGFSPGADVIRTPKQGSKV